MTGAVQFFSSNVDKKRKFLDQGRGWQSRQSRMETFNRLKCLKVCSTYDPDIGLRTPSLHSEKFCRPPLYFVPLLLLPLLLLLLESKWSMKLHFPTDQTDCHGTPPPDRKDRLEILRANRNFFLFTTSATVISMFLLFSSHAAATLASSRLNCPIQSQRVGGCCKDGGWHWW